MDKPKEVKVFMPNGEAFQYTLGHGGVKEIYTPDPRNMYGTLMVSITYDDDKTISYNNLPFVTRNY